MQTENIRLIFRWVLMVIFWGICDDARAQLLDPDVPSTTNSDLTFRQYEQGRYAMAAAAARTVLYNVNPVIPPAFPDPLADRAAYVLSQSALKTDLPGSLDSAVQARDAAADPVIRQRLGLGIAHYYFAHKAFVQAVPLYVSASEANLSTDEVTDSRFELAYCYFNLKAFDKAEPLFASVKEQTESRYFAAANYYYGLLAYNKNKYREALLSFGRVRDQPEYKQVVPYYIAELYYFMGNRDQAQKLADTLLRSREKSYYDKELHLLEAQCLYENKQYKEALPYFEFYYKRADKIRKQDLYEMGYCSFATSDWKGAIEKFRALSVSNDSLGQTAMYLLGQCYVQTGDKKSARSAFELCSEKRFNPGQQEVAMMLYARLSYELGFDDDALRQLNDLLKEFPHTSYQDEANTLISDLLVKTNNFSDALQHLESVGRKDHNYRIIYQKAAYGYAVQAFRNGRLDEASRYFKQSLEHPINPVYGRAAYFWQSELAWRERRYEETIARAEDFLNSKGDLADVQKLSPQANLQHAYLNLGYASMGLQQYDDAQGYFNKARQQHNGDAHTGMVAMVREADAVFMQKNFTKALGLYEKIITMDTAEADYARYQRAILLGLLGKSADKIIELKQIIGEVPPSEYANHARYELAVTYLETSKYGPALELLQQLTDSVSDKSFAPRAWMKTGFIYQQTGETDKAIESYKMVVVGYPSSEERLAAMDALKSLYIQGNQPAAYTRLLRENNLPSADSTTIDSTYYAAAEAQFSNGRWADARDGFDNYLREYPRGIFSIKATYYRGESNYQLKNNKDALADYKAILSGPWSDFFENSARRAASIAFEAGDYKAADGYYQQLRQNATIDQSRNIAWEGMMKCSYELGDFARSGAYADSLSHVDGLGEEQQNEAVYFRARALQQGYNGDAAIPMYQQLSKNKNGATAAECRYRIAEIYLQQSKLKEAEKAANDAIHESAGYDYWIVKSYLVLAQLLARQNDFFNARALLESIISHTHIEELKTEARKQLDDVNKSDKKNSKLSEEN